MDTTCVGKMNVAVHLEDGAERPGPDDVASAQLGFLDQSQSRHVGLRVRRRQRLNTRNTRDVYVKNAAQRHAAVWGIFSVRERGGACERGVACGRAGACERGGASERGGTVRGAGL